MDKYTVFYDKFMAFPADKFMAFPADKFFKYSRF